MGSIRFHWQNLNEKPGDRHGCGLRYGRCWLNLRQTTLSAEWETWVSKFALTLDVGGDENDFCLHLALPPVSLFLGVQGLFPYSRLPRDWGRTTGVRVFDWAIWFDIWNDDSVWSSDQPWWNSFNFHPVDFFLGDSKHSERTLSTEERVVPMPEGTYPCTVRMFESTWKRPRWFNKRMVRATVDIPSGVPFPGKGENSWDCGQDATFSSTGPARDPDQAIASLVESTLRRRRRYGGPGWRPEPREVSV